jgi:hypothetical protein
MLRKYLLGMIDSFSYSGGYNAADVNGDGDVDSIDFACMRSVLLGIIDKFPVEK